MNNLFLVAVLACLCSSCLSVGADTEPDDAVCSPAALPLPPARKAVPQAAVENVTEGAPKLVPKDAPKAVPIDNIEVVPRGTVKAEPSQHSPEDAVKAVPKDTVKAVAKDTVKAVPKDTVKAVPKDTVKAVPKDTVKAVPEDTAKAVPKDVAKATLHGVRPMRDRSNSSEPIPCTCGIFLSSQCKGAGPPAGQPAISHEFKRSTPNTALGIRQCTSACVDMIVKHLPNSAAILCSSIERDCMREKAFLFIKNVRNKWIATRLSAGREFCCKGGTAVKCPSRVKTRR